MRSRLPAARAAGRADESRGLPKNEAVLERTRFTWLLRCCTVPAALGIILRDFLPAGISASQLSANRGCLKTLVSARLARQVQLSRQPGQEGRSLNSLLRLCHSTVYRRGVQRMVRLLARRLVRALGFVCTSMVFQSTSIHYFCGLPTRDMGCQSTSIHFPSLFQSFSTSNHFFPRAFAPLPGAALRPPPFRSSSSPDL